VDKNIIGKLKELKNKDNFSLKVWEKKGLYNILLTQ